MTDLNQCSINNNLQQENNELRQKLEDASTSNQALDVYKNVINAAYNIGDSKANKEKEIERLKNNIHNQIYKQIDQYLISLIGKNLTFKEIMDYIKSKDLAVYSKLKCIALD